MIAIDFWIEMKLHKYCDLNVASLSHFDLFYAITFLFYNYQEKIFFQIFFISEYADKLSVFKYLNTLFACRFALYFDTGEEVASILIILLSKRYLETLSLDLNCTLYGQCYGLILHSLSSLVMTFFFVKEISVNISSCKRDFLLHLTVLCIKTVFW